jgi:acetyltransferase-like isoleucine patch superfamily enzyme
MIKEFNILGHADYYVQLEQNVNGEIYTWAVRWYASWFIKDLFALFPPQSLVLNIGDDNSGVHCNNNNQTFRSKVVNALKITFPNKVDENIRIKKAIDKFYKKNFSFPKAKRQSLIYRILKSILFRYVPETRLLFNKEINWNNQQNIKHNIEIGEHVKLNYKYSIINSTIGDYTYISPNASISYTKIGKFCSIGPNLICGWGIHPLDGISTHPMFYSKLKQNGITLSPNNKVQERKKIVIGNDVFIGANVTILDGITIGDGAVIGAGAIVSKDIPPYAIAVGNPIKVIKHRFNTETIEKLRNLKWWDMEMEGLKDIEKYFFNIEEFIKKHQ